MSETKYAESGSVVCHCGGCILSNSGRIWPQLFGLIGCSACERKFSHSIVLETRRAGEVVKLELQAYYKIGPADHNKWIDENLHTLADFIGEGMIGDKYEVEIIEMSEQEFKSLPEYAGP